MTARDDETNTAAIDDAKAELRDGIERSRAILVDYRAKLAEIQDIAGGLAKNSIQALVRSGH